MAEPRALSLDALRASEGGARVDKIAGGTATDEQLETAIVQAENEAEEVVGELFADAAFLDMIASATPYFLWKSLKTSDFPLWILQEKKRVDGLYKARAARVVLQPSNAASGVAGVAVRPAAHRPVRSGRFRRWLPGTPVTRH